MDGKTLIIHFSKKKYFLKFIKNAIMFIQDIFLNFNKRNIQLINKLEQKKLVIYKTLELVEEFMCENI